MNHYNGRNRNSNPPFATITPNPSSESTTQSASRNSSAECVPNTPNTLHPAATPAPTPEGASSTTMHSSGRNPSNAAPRRYGSGSGFPRSTISALISRAGTGNPAASNRPSKSRVVAEVTIAHRSSGRLSISCFTPGNTFRSAVSSISMSSITRSPSSASMSGLKLRTISIARIPCGTSYVSAFGMSYSFAHRCQHRTTDPMELISTPSISNKIPFDALREPADLKQHSPAVQTVAPPLALLATDLR